jgi:hypothetical protein
MKAVFRRLTGSLADDAYEIFATGLPTGDARDRLREKGVADGDAVYAIERLLNRGYLYEVEDLIFVTTPEEEASSVFVTQSQN